MSTNHFTGAQNKVFNEAKARLSRKAWYKGVCADHFPDDQQCANEFERAVSNVIWETAQWDDPNFRG